MPLLPVEPTSLVAQAPKVLGMLVTPGKWALAKLKYWVFRLRTLRRPFDEKQARQVAFQAVHGHVQSAIPYRNMGTKRIYIAVLRRTTTAGGDWTVRILEKVGRTYRQIWQSDPIYGFCHDDFSLEVVDVDRDGIHEVAFQQSTWGTGQGSNTLYVYSTLHKKLYTIRETFITEAGAMVAPIIEIEGEPDEVFRIKLEDFAVKQGFLLEGDPVDLDHPDNAAARWHVDNEAIDLAGEDGYVNFSIVVVPTYYETLSEHFKEWTCDELDTPEVIWRAYFKGPLIGYMKSDRKYFVVYSPASAYNWVVAQIFENGRLWFGLHMARGLVLYEHNSRKLTRYLSYNGSPLPTVFTLDVEGNDLVINGELLEDDVEPVLRVPLNDLRRLSTADPFNRQGEYVTHDEAPNADQCRPEE
jgi:hypothetical protein